MKSLKELPEQEKLLEWFSSHDKNVPFRINNHIHSPYSFSAFTSLSEAFTMAEDSQLHALGLNDFFVADGYHEFWDLAQDHKIFPLFNIEFIGLLDREQKAGVRINDPNNPGRIYFSGKGLDYPFHLSFQKRRTLKKLKANSQKQVQEMIRKMDHLLKSINPSLEISYSKIKADLAKDLVRERHIAKTLRILLYRHFLTIQERKDFLKSLYNGKESLVNMEDHAALENELRSNLLKSGGAAFVEERPDSFLPLENIIELIRNAGGIPCYPVLLDDKSGSFTEFEEEKVKLSMRLKELNIHCIELIPGRNDKNILEDFVRYFASQDFMISFGTEHNAPEMIPLQITARGGQEIATDVLQIANEGACIIAAHQYLRAWGHQGYIYNCGTWAKDRKDEFIFLGKAVISYFTHRYTGQN